jgi:hypothetical protein
VVDSIEKFLDVKINHNAEQGNRVKKFVTNR